MKPRKMSRLEKREDRQQRLKDALKGEGLYVFENNSRGDLQLPKPLASGKAWVRPGEQFQGDSYYNSLIGKGLKLVRTITDPNTERTTMQEQKLILDQPDRVTHKGTTEHVIPAQKPQALHEGQPKQEQQKEVLINEDPMAGVEIILN